MRKVVYHWEWYISDYLTIGKSYIVKEERKFLTRKNSDSLIALNDTKEYLIINDNGKEEWYKAYLFEDLDKVRDSKLEQLLK